MEIAGVDASRAIDRGGGFYAEGFREKAGYLDVIPFALVCLTTSLKARKTNRLL